jgi:ABC-type amino acid transport substrate-binding protein
LKADSECGRKNQGSKDGGTGPVSPYAKIEAEGHVPVQSQVLLLLIACGLAVAPARSQSIASPEVASHRSPDAALPVNFIRRTGDLDSMVKRGNIRALVLYSRSGFFYVNGKPEGIYYEALQYFEKFVNQKLHTRQHVQVTFIPVRPDQIQAALIQGVGDLIAYGVAETSERGHQIAFSIPIQTGVKQIVVTQKNSGALLSLEDLGGKQVFVNPLSAYYGNLEKVNNTLRERGKSPILIRKAETGFCHAKPLGDHPEWCRIALCCPHVIAVELKGADDQGDVFVGDLHGTIMDQRSPVVPI